MMYGEVRSSIRGAGTECAAVGTQRVLKYCKQFV